MGLGVTEMTPGSAQLRSIWGFLGDLGFGRQSIDTWSQRALTEMTQSLARGVLGSSGPARRATTGPSLTVGATSTHTLGTSALTCMFQPSPLVRGATQQQPELSTLVRVSTHAPHARGDRLHRLLPTTRVGFNPRPSCEGRHPTCKAQILTDDVSTHAPHARGDLVPPAPVLPHRLFQPTPLMRGATPRATKEGSNERVSIHAPHARGDLAGAPRVRRLRVSTHATHARGDAVSEAQVYVDYQFQPTPLMRGATRAPLCNRRPSRCFNPRPSCEGRPVGITICIATHESFNPRPSCEGRPGGAPVPLDGALVSTHAPHARGDPSDMAEPTPVQFQPTPLMRGATDHGTAAACRRRCFNPRPSCEGRLQRLCEHRLQLVSTHAPHARGDCGLVNLATFFSFQPTPLMRGATRVRGIDRTIVMKFQPTPLMRGATGGLYRRHRCD